jgi:hypothetical protein
VSLRLHGQYRTALVLYAAACESLLDTAMQLLLWEAGGTPEEAATQFLPPKGLEGRVKATLPQLVGGHWGGRPGSAVDTWRSRILYPRNLSIHSGLGVTREVAWEAMAAVDSLRMYLAERVFEKRRLYAIAALAIAADLLILPKSGSLGTAVQAAAAAGDGRLLPRFQRWRQCLTSIVTDRFAPRTPSMTNGGLVAVSHPSTKWLGSGTIGHQGRLARSLYH